MIRTRPLLLTLLTIFCLTGCGSHLAASATLDIVGKKVADGVFGKVVFDPVWEFFFGNPNAKEADELKENFAKVVTEKVLDAMIPSAHAEALEFRCEPKEPEEECRNRAASMAELGFNVYANRFVATFRQCRDHVVLSPDTGAADYTRQVDLITDCISGAGYQKEITLILSHIQKSAE